MAISSEILLKAQIYFMCFETEDEINLTFCKIFSNGSIILKKTYKMQATLFRGLCSALGAYERHIRLCIFE